MGKQAGGEDARIEADIHIVLCGMGSGAGEIGARAGSDITAAVIDISLEIGPGLGTERLAVTAGIAAVHINDPEARLTVRIEQHAVRVIRTSFEYIAHYKGVGGTEIIGTVCCDVFE